MQTVIQYYYPLLGIIIKSWKQRELVYLFFGIKESGNEDLSPD